MKTWKPLNFDLCAGRKLLMSVAFISLPVAAVFAQDGTDRPAVPRPLNAATEAARSAVPDEEDRENLIRAAQERLRKETGKSTAPTTITDRSSSGETLRARPAGTPTPATPTPTPAASTASETPAPKPLTPKPAAADTPPAPKPVPAPVPLAANSGNVPPPVPLRPRYDKSPSTASGGEVMEITANESVMDEKNNKATFKGDVVVHHPTFVMKSEYLEVFMNDKDSPQLGPDGKEPPFKKAIATGPMVVIEQSVVESGKQVVQIAKARQAEFDGITGDTILTGGPPFLQKGKQVIRPQSEKAKIVLKSDGEHRVEGRNRVEFQIKGGKGGGTKGPSIGGSLDSITNKRN